MSNNKQYNADDFVGKSDSELKAQQAALELEERELDLVIKRAQVAEIRQKQQAALDRVRGSQQAIAAFLANRRANQIACNHLKGGVGAEAVIRGKGQSAMAAVIKHQLPNGSWLVLCQRCGAEWYGPLTALQNSGVPRKATRIGKVTYWDAIQMATNNSESRSSQFVFQEAVPITPEDTEGDE